MLPTLVLFPNSLSVLHPITQVVTRVMEVVKRSLERAQLLQPSLERAQEGIKVQLWWDIASVGSTAHCQKLG